MSKAVNYCRLMRIKHWIKNVIVMIPPLFGKVVFEQAVMIQLVLGFFVFSLASSAVYVLNDLCDIENDRNHPTKCSRPLASGAVSKTEGMILFVLCVAGALVINWFAAGLSVCYLIPVLYVLLNIMYSKSWKHKPVIDIVVLVSGYVLRLEYGSIITGVRVSNWLYLTLIALALFMAFGKRHNEKKACGDSTRAVLEQYSLPFLRSNMYMYLGAFIIFYSLWSIDSGASSNMVITAPLVMIMTMRYTYDIENNDEGNPVDVILGDLFLILLGVVYAAAVVLLLYFPDIFRVFTA